MVSPNLSQEITTTLRNRSKALADNVSNHNALLRRLKQKGNIKLLDGGRDIVEPLRYQETSTFKYFTGYETLDVTPTDIISAANFDWKSAAVSITLSGDEMRKNSGSSQLFDVLEAKIENAEDTMMNNISSGLYADGTGSSGKEIGGLQSIIADDPTTGTVGGINRANFSFYRNQVADYSSDHGGAASSSNIQAGMLALWLACTRGTDKPDLIVGDNTYWTHYWNSLTANQRFGGEKEAQAGFSTLKFMDADVIFDTGGGCPTGRWYFLNTKYLFFKVHQDANFAPLENREPVNQDAIVKHIIFMGNLTCANAARQGVAKD